MQVSGPGWFDERWRQSTLGQQSSVLQAVQKALQWFPPEVQKAWKACLQPSALHIRNLHGKKIVPVSPSCCCPFNQSAPHLFPCNGIIGWTGKYRVLNLPRTKKRIFFVVVLVHLHNALLLPWKHSKKSWLDCWEFKVNSIPRDTVRTSSIFPIKYSCGAQYP